MNSEVTPIILVVALFAFAFLMGSDPRDGIRAFHDRDLHESYGERHGWR